MHTVVFTGNANGAAMNTKGGRIALVAYGTFGSGTVTLEYSHDGTNYVSTGVTKTAAGMGVAEVPRGKVRAAMTGATTPSVTAVISGAIAQ